MEDRVGQRLGNYQLMRLLGEGGFAEVYLGKHIELGTQAAIKVLTTKISPEEVEHFRAEARTIARLKHPHIVSVLDFGMKGRIPFIVMDYAPSGSLRTLHPKGTHVPLQTVVSYVKQIATALQYAHDQKLIHRDIKPDNMLLGRNKEVLLSDFGIAVEALSSHLLKTQEGFGTIYYMAPEQILGKPRIASDQYALGVVVYEWLSGIRPFTGNAAEVGMQHLLASPPPLREKVPAVPLDVEQVVMTALAKDPHQRFASVQAFANALEQASQLAETPGQERYLSVSSAFPAHDPPPTRDAIDQVTVADSTVMKNTEAPMPAGSSTTIFPPEGEPSINKPLLRTETVPVYYQTSPPSPLPLSTTLPQGLRRKHLLRGTAILLLILVLLMLVSAGGLWLYAITQSQTKVTYDSFVATNGIMFGFDVQHTRLNPYEHLLNPTTVVGLTQKWVYATGGAIFSSPAVVGGVVYTGSNDGNLYALDATSGAKKWAYQTEGGYVDSSPAVVGGLVYVGSDDGNVYALDAASGAKKWAYQTGDHIFSSPAVVGGVVYVGSYNHNVYALDAASGAKKWVYQTGGIIVSSPAVVGGVVYVGSYDGNVYALDAASGAKKWVYVTGGAIFSSPAVAGGVVYVGSRDGNVYALDAASGAKKWAYQTGGYIDSSPVVVGGVVYTGSFDHSMYAFHLQNI
ncbi:MAG: hypothetical protein NVSMB27_13960 [Ktedonobacteraceae bacterium]